MNRIPPHDSILNKTFRISQFEQKSRDDLNLTENFTDDLNLNKKNIEDDLNLNKKNIEDDLNLNKNSEDDFNFNQNLQDDPELITLITIITYNYMTLT